MRIKSKKKKRRQKKTRKMNNTTIIAKQGFKPIAIALFLAIIFDLIIGCSFMGNLLYLLTFVLLIVYRNPERSVYSDENEVLAPIDGKVIAIDEYEGKKNIYIDVSLCDTHILRAPLGGDFETLSHRHGLNLSHFTYKASKLNEKALLSFENKLKIELLSGFCTPSIKLPHDHKINKGERMGVFMQGSAKIILDADKETFVNIGDKVYAGETIIAKV